MVPVERKEYDNAFDFHKEVLKRHRNQKKWQVACMEDDLDLEADRIMSDINNLEEEKQFYLNYQKNITMQELEQMDEEADMLQRAQSELAETLHRGKTH